MPRLTTFLALRRLLNDENYLLRWMQAGYSKDDRSRFKYRLDHDQLTLDKIEEILEKCGCSVAVEKQWNLPTP